MTSIITTYKSQTTPRKNPSHGNIIWGNGDYDLDVETDDWVVYACVARRDLGLRFGPPLTMTGICNSAEQAWEELDRMLGVWAGQIQSGHRVTKAQGVSYVT
ncbi:hypothetical protein BKA61DRAFT_575331 [Leptodontidium sp. MPI-SDFR-AT-0119]|nr:hypothetical protein BKA61DRAFT_575331 [Leptodontidium sp. MPI-SDFR-AT-0119]